MAGEKNMRHSHATHDLYNAIAEGDYPEWTWYIQVMPVETDPASIGFDPLDDTKVCHQITNLRAACRFLPSQRDFGILTTPRQTLTA